jgi:integrase
MLTRTLIDSFVAGKYHWQPTTKTTADKHLAYWMKFLDGRSIDEVGIVDFEVWRGDLGLSESMNYNSLVFMRSYLRWLGKDDHPLLTHSVKRHESKMQPYLTLDEYLKLFEAACNTTPKGIQDATIVTFLWETWARADSVINTMLHNIDSRSQEVHFIEKGGDYHTSAYGPDLAQMLDEWLPVRRQISMCDSLFVSIRFGTPLTYWGLREILDALGNNTGIYVTPHMFRRGGARNHASDGGSDRQGMEQGGWKSHAMYLRYTRGVSLDAFKAKSFRGAI